jgi:hypothetical protein
MPRNSDNSLTQFLIFLAIALVAGFFNWLKHRGNKPEVEEEDEYTTPPPQRPAQPAPRRRNWEEELRRLLEENKPAQPAPPIIREVRPVATQPVLQREREPEPPPLVSPGPPVLAKPWDLPQPQFVPLAEHTQRVEKAHHLQEMISKRLSDVSDRVRTHAHAAIVQKPTYRAREAVAYLRNPTTLRAVVVAGVVLGPPKGLENI